MTNKSTETEDRRPNQREGERFAYSHVLILNGDPESAEDPEEFWKEQICKPFFQTGNGTVNEQLILVIHSEHNLCLYLGLFCSDFYPLLMLLEHISRETLLV